MNCIIGCLVADVELKKSTSSLPFAIFTVSYSGVEEIDVYVEKNLAEVCAKYLKKGHRITVTGELMNGLLHASDVIYHTGKTHE